MSAVKCFCDCGILEGEEVISAHKMRSIFRHGSGSWLREGHLSSQEMTFAMSWSMWSLSESGRVTGVLVQLDEVPFGVFPNLRRILNKTVAATTRFCHERTRTWDGIRGNSIDCVGR